MLAPRFVALLALLALVAGCGDDDNGGGDKPAGTTGTDEPARIGTDQPSQANDANANAAAFIDCFEKPGYEARRPKPREESVFAFTAKSKGFKVAAVNVSKKGMLSPTAYLAVFESAAEASRAMAELNTTSTGEVEPQQSGPAVVGYLSAGDQKAVGAAVDACLK